VDTGLSTLDLSRTYTSNDWAYSGGPTGVFGRGWHHDWEAWLSCTQTKCTVALGLNPGYQFMPTGTAPSLDGTETWQVYGPWSNAVMSGDNQNVLVRRPSGEWIMFSPDGRELHFATVCDACGGTDVFCQDPATGGKARLVKVVDR
jgi:Tol biopolymer transport system component